MRAIVLLDAEPTFRPFPFALPHTPGADRLVSESGALAVALAGPLRRADRLLSRRFSGRRHSPAVGTLCRGDGRVRGADARVQAGLRSRRPALRGARGGRHPLSAPRRVHRPRSTPLDRLRPRAALCRERSRARRCSPTRRKKWRSTKATWRASAHRGLPQRRLRLCARRLPRAPSRGSRAPAGRVQGRRAALGGVSIRHRRAGLGDTVACWDALERWRDSPREGAAA